MKNSKNIFKVSALVLGAVVLSAFAFLSISETQVEELSAQASHSTELLAMNTIDFDGKCGEGKCGEGKKSEKKEEKAKKSEKKEEGKCGEGKCGEGKNAEKKSEKKEEKKEEGKCGEGKCGGQ